MRVVMIVGLGVSVISLGVAQANTLTPEKGISQKGHACLVRGSGFSVASTTVCVDGSPASFDVLSSSALIVIVPPGPIGTVIITIDGISGPVNLEFFRIAPELSPTEIANFFVQNVTKLQNNFFDMVQREREVASVFFIGNSGNATVAQQTRKVFESRVEYLLDRTNEIANLLKGDALTALSQSAAPRPQKTSVLAGINNTAGYTFAALDSYTASTKSLYAAFLQQAHRQSVIQVKWWDTELTIGLQLGDIKKRLTRKTDVPFGEPPIGPQPLPGKIGEVELPPPLTDSLLPGTWEIVRQISLDTPNAPAIFAKRDLYVVFEGGHGILQAFDVPLDGELLTTTNGDSAKAFGEFKVITLSQPKNHKDIFIQQVNRTVIKVPSGQPEANGEVIATTNGFRLDAPRGEKDPSYSGAFKPAGSDDAVLQDHTVIFEGLNVLPAGTVLIRQFEARSWVIHCMPGEVAIVAYVKWGFTQKLTIGPNNTIIQQQMIEAPPQFVSQPTAADKSLLEDNLKDKGFADLNAGLKAACAGK